MLRKIFTVAAIVAATGGAFVKSANASVLLQVPGWFDSDDNPISTDTAQLCQNQTNTTCAYHLDPSGEVDQERTNPFEN